MILDHHDNVDGWVSGADDVDGWENVVLWDCWSLQRTETVESRATNGVDYCISNVCKRMSTVYERFSWGDLGRGEFCAVVTNEGTVIAQRGLFHLFLDIVINSSLSPYSPTLYTLMLPSLELSSSFRELSAFLAFIITKGEV